MGGPPREPSSYFSFSPRGVQSANSSPPVSPGASLPRHSPSSVSGSSVRRPSAFRSESDKQAGQPRVKVQTIEEGVVYNEAPPLRGKPRDHSPAGRPSSDLRESVISAPRSAPPSPSTATLQHQQVDESATRREPSTRPPSKPRPGRRWSRTKSGSVWYERLKGSSTHSHSKQSSEPSQHSSESKPRIMPLTPPTPPSVTRGPPYRHQVKVEKSFTSLKSSKLAKPETHHSSLTPSTGSRRTSINPLRLFSAPFHIFRKLSLPRQTSRLGSQEARELPTVAAAPPRHQMRGHMSSLKRTHTSDALRQVTSILHETSPLSVTCSPVTVVRPLASRQMSDKSSSSKGSVQPKSCPTKTKRGTILMSPVLSRRSTHDMLEEPVSYSTSQWELKMGGQPANTPDEKATYKVKRSPSVDTEEFLKVDISIRGETSYLPSEARRIHTPPAPQEMPDGKRRGFFFDYNAPRSPQSREVSVCKPSRPRHSLPSDQGSIPKRSTSWTSTTHKRPFTLSPRATKKTGRAATGDWYDAKLAELDTSEDEAPCSHNGRPILGRGRSATTKSGTSLAEIKQRKEEEKFDYSIPEHLPNSPLCPRNARYWRVVQGRGSQFHGCWMHGVGVWAEGEGMFAGFVG